MTAVLPVRRPGAASALPPAGDPRLLIGQFADQAGHVRAASPRALAPWLVRAIVGLAVLAFSRPGRRTARVRLPHHHHAHRQHGPRASSRRRHRRHPDRRHRRHRGHGHHLPPAPSASTPLITHRVIAARHRPRRHRHRADQGRRQRRPQTPGPPPSTGDTAYQVQAVIPELGHLIQALRTPVVAQVLTYGAPTLLVGWILLTIWRPTRDEEAQA